MSQHISHLSKTPRRLARLSVFCRVILAILGGYALSALGAQFLALAFSQFGMLRSEAVVLSAMLSFLIYLTLLLWAFAERRLHRVMFLLGLIPLLLYFLATYLIQ